MSSRSRRRVANLILSGTAVVLFLAIALAKDFWIAKPYSSWNEQEAMAILMDSPWSRPSPLPGNYGGRSTPSVIQMGQGRTNADVAQTQGLGGSNTIPLYVRWHSSLKVRQALARINQLRGLLSDAEAERFLAQSSPDIQIAISCPVMEPFAKATMETLAPKTFLTSKKDKSKKIVMKGYSSPKERQDEFAVFLFPREVDGKPAIEPADDEIVFTTKIEKAEIRAAFRLSRMMIDGQLDN
jgi:hypothetical protein